MQKVPKVKKRVRKVRRVNRVRDVEDIVDDQIEKYNKIVEENGKDIRYIG